MSRLEIKNSIIFVFFLLLLSCENYGRNSEASSIYQPESSTNGEAIKAMTDFFALRADVAIARQDGTASGSHGPCQVNVRLLREPQGQGRGFEISLSETLDAGQSKNVQFRIWDFAPSKRPWSHKRDVGTVINQPVDIRLGGVALTASVRAVGFNSDNILMFQQSIEQELAVRKSENGGLEITLKNNESGMLANLLGVPDVVSCRFDNTNV